MGRHDMKCVGLALVLALSCHSAANSACGAAPPGTFQVSDVRITLLREPAGMYPAYAVTLCGTGVGEFTGYRNCLVSGTHQFEMEPAAVMGLLDKFYAAWFFDLGSDFGSWMHVEVLPDGSTRTIETETTGGQPVQLTVQIGEYIKSIKVKFGAPMLLRGLATAVDSTAGAWRYVRRPEWPWPAHGREPSGQAPN